MTDTCNSCGAAILWAITGLGRRMPVDAAPHPDGNLVMVYDAAAGHWRAEVVSTDAAPDLHRAHFVTCPDADQWRRRRR